MSDEPFIQIIDALVAQLDSETTHDANEPDVWEQIREKFNNRYLYDSDGDCKGTVNVERTTEEVGNVIRISLHIGGQTLKMNYQTFKTWLLTDKYQVRELVE